ncbi:MAG TPA: VOC family protein [Gemmatimonadales bacterium]|jgi:catechol 2,3-dioxygenase-like lactoylglutathione lyase family enzyme
MITQVKFVGIPVADQERALAFYTGKLGFAVTTDQPMGNQRWIELRCGTFAKFMDGEGNQFVLSSARGK